MKKNNIIGFVATLILSLIGLKVDAQFEADFSMTGSASPVNYTGYPSTGTITLRLSYPTNADAVPAQAFAVIISGSNSVEFNVAAFVPPSGWAVDPANSNEGNVVVYNTVALSDRQGIPLSFVFPVKAVKAGSTQIIWDVSPFNAPVTEPWADPVSDNHQGDVLITVANSPLPVNLVSFTASKAESSALLNWQTVEEVGFNHFEVERSTDPKAGFKQIGKVSAKGSSRSGGHYSFADHGIAGGSDYYYRLKMVDVDGSFEYSKIAVVHFEGISRAYPNPAISVLKVETTNWTTVNKVEMVDVNGKIVSTHDSVTGRQISVSKLPAGVYFVRISYQDGTSISHKIVKQ